MTALRVLVAPRDLGKCCKCSGAIRAGAEYAIEPWPNGGGFDHLHVECPAPPALDPDRRTVIQGHDA